MALGHKLNGARAGKRATALPDRPSIAVLPFDNLSGQPEETYFADGITEDIITELSRFRSLFVIARNSSFQFRGDVDVADVRARSGSATSSRAASARLATASA